MQTSDIVFSIIGGLAAAGLAVLSYLAVRLIEQYDKFQEKTDTNIENIRSSLKNQEVTIGDIKVQATIAADNAGVDQETKGKISSLLLGLAKIEQEIKRIKPIVERSDDDHGKVMVLDDKLRSQEKQLKTLFETVRLLAQQRQRGQ